MMTMMKRMNRMGCLLDPQRFQRRLANLCSGVFGALNGKKKPGSGPGKWEEKSESEEEAVRK
jgi:hypothetical protein